MCPRCKSEKIRRSKRRGLRDRMWGLLGRWPYRCKDCSFRFRRRIRYAAPPPSPTPGTTARALEPRVDLAFRTHPCIPLAKVLLRAESQEQLEQMLVTIERTVGSYQHSAK